MTARSLTLDKACIMRVPCLTGIESISVITSAFLKTVSAKLSPGVEGHMVLDEALTDKLSICPHTALVVGAIFLVSLRMLLLLLLQLLFIMIMMMIK